MKKILVITYYWPPELGVGVQRIQKFCQYLSNYGYEPVVLTVSHKRLPVNEVFIKENNVDVARIYYWFDPTRWLGNGEEDKTAIKPNQEKKEKPSDVYHYLLHFIWANFFIPDSKIGWYFPARQAVKTIMKKFDISAVLSTGPPFTPHLVSLYVKKKYSIPWIVDARDPWVENANYNFANRFSAVMKINARLESKVYNQSDLIVTVGENLGNLIRNKISDRKKVKIIYNGYDEREFANFQARKNQKFKIGHYGSILNEQIPFNFLQSLKRAIQNDKQFAADFVFELYGPLMEKVSYEIENHIPATNRTFNNSLLRNDLIDKLQDEQVQLLLITTYKQNELVVSSKIFEYVRAGWPVLIIGPVNGEAGSIVRLADTGKIFTYEDKEGPIEFILKMYRKWKTEGLRQNKYTNPVFERQEQARQLAQLFDELLLEQSKP